MCCLYIIAMVDNLPGPFSTTSPVIATAVDSDSESASIVMQYNSCYIIYSRTSLIRASKIWAPLLSRQLNGGQTNSKPWVSVIFLTYVHKGIQFLRARCHSIISFAISNGKSIVALSDDFLSTNALGICAFQRYGNF